MVEDLFLVGVVLIEEEVVAEEMTGAVQRVEIYQAEEVIRHLEAVDLNILRQATILDPSIIQVMFKYWAFMKYM